MPAFAGMTEKSKAAHQAAFDFIRQVTALRA